MYVVYMGALALPVAPSKLQLDIKNRNETVELINGQEINFLKTPGLSEIQFDAIIPSVSYPFAYYEDGFLEPDIYLTWFEKLKTEHKVFPFKVAGNSDAGKSIFHQSMDVSLESYTVSESTDQGFDLSVSFQLKQYVKFSTKKIEIEKSTDGKVELKVTEQRPAKESPKAYTVKAGDNLWNICKKQLGDGSKYKEVARLNKIANPSLIHPGQVIRFE